jgi:acyl CoA:acetate/3-ketoacid CoA transferase alpha subunit/acyl CoA:acetate/3-ketoacid CoA transferase beta subunit
MERLSLADAVARHVRPKDTVHVVLGHSRWTAAARELARQTWGSDPGFTLVMLSLSSLGALFFAGGLVRKVVTAYSGDAFPTYSPNPVFQQAYASGAVEVEHWSFLSYVQRLEAAARGLPAIATRSLRGSNMADNPDYHEVETPLGSVSLLAPLVPDVALLHAPVADEQGNVALAPPLLEGVWGVHAARRGAIVTVDRVVKDLRGLPHTARVPAHRVLAVAEVPFGAHPGGLHAPGLPVDSYGEDVDFWIEARAASRDGTFGEWARRWCLETDSQESYLDRLGAHRLQGLRRRAEPDSWRDDDLAWPVDAERPVTAWETAATWAAREVADRVAALGADGVLAGAGVANLAAWVGVAAAREAGHPVALTAELGLWGYQPTPADPSIFNHRSFPTAAMLTDATEVLGVLVGGPGTTTLGCLGAAQVDAAGNLNSTLIPDGPFLVGSGGGNDVVTTADESLVITLLRPGRTPERVGYVTSPGGRVRTVVTDRGVLRKRDGDRLRLSAVPAGPEPLSDRARRAVGSCGWDLEVERELTELAPPERAEVRRLREFDRRGWFIGDRG